MMIDLIGPLMKFLERLVSRRPKTFLVIALILVTLGLTLLESTLPSEQRARLYHEFFQAVPIIAVGLGSLIAVVSMLSYLKGTGGGINEAIETAFLPYQSLDEIQDLLAKVRARSAAGGIKADGDPASRDPVEELRAKLSAELNTKLEAFVAHKSSDDNPSRNITETFAATTRRLREEISALGRRGNLNLAIGVLTTGFAIISLLYMVITTTMTFTSLPALLSHYIPRLTTIIFIEVFSFFFLRLYKTALSEIKFYQNELTSLAAWEIALQMARESKDADNIKLVIQHLVAMRQTAPALRREPEPALINTKDLGETVERLTKLISELTAKAKHTAAAS